MDHKPPDDEQLPHTYTLFTPGTATAPKVCRDFVRSALGAEGLGRLADTAAVCTSELVTNVHLHVGGEVHLRLAVEREEVRVAVYDGGGGSGRPVPRRAGVGELGGRGLFLVTALADGCGVTAARPGTGVWFTLGRGTSPGGVGGA
ncbi:ATP-binding protein [Streptomyces sp. H39-S7]|uniref:ATP-binding protein n=1 Tax=Streptomyces sp. H39-S7 TaxID=3004357 RepID=UPI0022B021E4|nr:ATP-binding protein [Streptomyces sp. H39-S7]MCZ4120747.1 ATP-binding protein [Streptomyces sp. H39-S7]